MAKKRLWLTLVLILVMIVVPARDAEARASASYVLQAGANDLIAEVNALRAANGLPPYLVNPILMQIAQDQANYMAATGQVAHRPGLTQRILDAGYPLAGDLSQGGFRAENIIGNVTSAALAVQSWTGDAPHLNTMLSLSLTEIGAGVVKVGDRYFMAIEAAQPTTGRVSQPYTPLPGAPSPENFSPGDFIVPVTLSTPDINGMVFHEVQYGQSLWAIAIEYGVKIDEIRALNNLGPETEIYQGDRLLIRKDTPSAPESTLTLPTPPTEPVIYTVSTVFFTATMNIPVLTATEAAVSLPEQDNIVTGTVLGIILATVVFAGLLTWIISRKSV